MICIICNCRVGSFLQFLFKPSDGRIILCQFSLFWACIGTLYMCLLFLEAIQGVIFLMYRSFSSSSMCLQVKSLLAIRAEDETPVSAVSIRRMPR